MTRPGQLQTLMAVMIATLASSAAMAESTAQESLGQLPGRVSSEERELLFWLIIAVAFAAGAMLIAWLISEGASRDDIEDSPDLSALWKSQPKAEWFGSAEFRIAATNPQAGAKQPLKDVSMHNQVGTDVQC